MPAKLQNKEMIEIRREKKKIWSHIRHKWLEETPEETVRQEFVCHLVNEYGFALVQMDEEVSPPGDARGRGDARADVLIWRSVKDRQDGGKALIVVECKADTVTIDRKTYEQGAHYAQYEQARFLSPTTAGKQNSGKLTTRAGFRILTKSQTSRTRTPATKKLKS